MQSPANFSTSPPYSSSRSMTWRQGVGVVGSRGQAGVQGWWVPRAAAAARSPRGPAAQAAHRGEVAVHALGQQLHARAAPTAQRLGQRREPADVGDHKGGGEGVHAGPHRAADAGRRRRGAAAQRAPQALEHRAAGGGGASGNAGQLGLEPCLCCQTHPLPSRACGFPVVPAAATCRLPRTCLRPAGHPQAGRPARCTGGACAAQRAPAWATCGLRGRRAGGCQVVVTRAHCNLAC